MSGYKSSPAVRQIGVVIYFCFLFAAAPLGVARTQKNFFQGSDLNDGNNYNPAGLPSDSFDVLLNTPPTTLTLSAAVLNMGSLNVTADNVAYTISNNTATSTNSTIFLANLIGTGNSISGHADDVIFVGGMNSSLTIQGANGGSGSGGLSLGSGIGGSLNVAQASSNLTISAPIALGTSPLTKIGAGTLNLSSALSIGGGSGTLAINQGTANLLPGFAAGANFNLSVNNSVAGPAPDVTVYIQSSVQFRSLSGSVAGPSSQAIVNLMGTSTQLTLGVLGGGTFAGSITGAGSVLYSASNTETFSGNNTYSGTTTVAGGTLRIDGTTSGQGNYAVSGSGGILTGSGTIDLATNNTLLVSAGRLTTGGTNATGTLNVLASGTGGVIIRDQGAFFVDIGSAGSSDLLAIGGGYIDITSASDTLTLNSLAGAFDGSTYTIATFAQNLSGGTFNTVTGLPSNYSVAYTSNSIMLLPVPEPRTVVLVAELGGLLFCLARFRKHKTAARVPMHQRAAVS